MNCKRFLYFFVLIFIANYSKSQHKIDSILKVLGVSKNDSVKIYALAELAQKELDNYAKRIQQSMLPSEKYISKKIMRKKSFDSAQDDH